LSVLPLNTPVGTNFSLLTYILQNMPSPGTIVVVDDNKSDRGLVQSIFTHLQIPDKALFFSNGKEALDYLTSTNERPFLILSDVEMPLMTGFELQKAMYDNETLRKKAIPFVFFTGAASAERVQNAFEYHAQGFFIKEMDFDKLVQQVKLILDYWKNSQRVDNF
jgi:CheY-like chemotaxis protein